MASLGKRKSAADLVKSEVEAEMRRRKLAALKENADFSFLIGPVKESAVVCLFVLPLVLNKS